MDDKRSPTFSIILSTYNRAHLVDRTLRSVLAQTYQDFEIIVVDDASTDETAAVVTSFDDERIIYIRHEKNGGVAVANNTAIRQAKGEYICFLGDVKYTFYARDSQTIEYFKDDIYLKNPLPEALLNLIYIR